jgi:hypothetical protein
VRFYRQAFLYAGLCACTHTASAQATEICVKCSGPDASYACVVNAQGGRLAADGAVKLYCITALAQSGPHQSCAIDRNSVAPCQGIRKELPIPTLDADDDAPASPPAAKTEATPAAPATTAKKEADAAPATVPQDEATGPPKTVQEMVEKSAQSATAGVEKANKSVGDGLKNAGNAVGDAAKKTWKCLSSLFSDC